MSALRVVLSAAAPHTVPATYVHKDARQSTCKCKCTQTHIDNAEQIRQSHTLTRLSEKMVLLRDSTTTWQLLAATLSRSADMVWVQTRRTCCRCHLLSERGTVNPEVVGSIPATTQKTENSNLHGFYLNRPSRRCTKLLLQVIKAIINQWCETSPRGHVFKNYQAAMLLKLWPSSHEVLISDRTCGISAMCMATVSAFALGSG